MTVPGIDTAQSGQHRSWLPLGVTVLSLMMAFGFSLFVWNLMATIERLNTSLTSVRGEVDRLSAEVERRNQLLTSQESAVISLKSSSGNAKGLVILNRTRNVVLAWDLEPLAAAERYGFWEVKGRDTTMVGVFHGEESGSSMIVLDSVSLGTRLHRTYLVALDRGRGSSRPGRVVLKGEGEGRTEH